MLKRLLTIVIAGMILCVTRGPSPAFGVNSCRSLAPGTIFTKTRYPINVETAADEDALAIMTARILADQIKEKPDSVLGLATGGTPLKTYRELIRIIKEEGIDLSRVRTFNLDEYCGIEKTYRQSYFSYMRENLFNHLLFDPVKNPGGIRPENIHIPNGMADDREKECREYEVAIRQAGGIDIQLLGIGENGHIGFNEPGSSIDSLTREVELTRSTREANARFFGGDIGKVPRSALSMGIHSILSAKKIVLIAMGKNKMDAIKKMIEEEPTEAVPASLLQFHPAVTVITTAEIAGGLLPSQRGSRGSWIMSDEEVAALSSVVDFKRPPNYEKLISLIEGTRFTRDDIAAKEAPDADVIGKDGMGFVIKIPRGTFSGLGAKERQRRLRSGYMLAEKGLGGLVADFVIVAGLKITYGGKTRNVKRAVIQRRTTPLIEALRTLFAAGDIVRVRELLRKKIAVDRGIMRRGYFMHDNFLNQYGVTDEGAVVLRDPGQIVEDPAARSEPGEEPIGPSERFNKRGFAHYETLYRLNSLAGQAGVPAMGKEAVDYYAGESGLDFSGNVKLDVTVEDYEKNRGLIVKYFRNTLNIPVAEWEDIFLLEASLPGFLQYAMYLIVKDRYADKFDRIARAEFELNFGRDTGARTAVALTSASLFSRTGAAGEMRAPARVISIGDYLNKKPPADAAVGAAN